MIRFRKPGSLILVYWKEELESLFQAKMVPFPRRVWYALHGFSPAAAWFKGVDRQNFRNFLKDHTYYKHTPYNNPTATDKISKVNFRQTLCDFSDYLPRYYAELSGGVVKPLDSWPAADPCDGAEAVVRLLEKEGRLAFKLVQGRSGKGFLVGRYHGPDSYSFNDAPCDRKAAVQTVAAMNGYIVTEYVRQCEAYEAIWSRTSHTLRIQTTNVMTGKAEIAFAFLRFGSSRVLHAVSHINCPGNYTAIIDPQTGHTKKVISVDEGGRSVLVHTHPETGEDLELNVPHWELIASACLRMHDEKLSDLSWLGWDIMVTDDGFRILEINTLTGLIGVEADEPILASQKLRPIFEKLMQESRARKQ